jgi:hypothetical protein
MTFTSFDSASTRESSGAADWGSDSDSVGLAIASAAAQGRRSANSRQAIGSSERVKSVSKRKMVTGRTGRASQTESACTRATTITSRTYGEQARWGI